jgi:putative NADH-flavin reductase
MKILVYGGTGRVGSAIVAEAAVRGHEVIAASRRAPSTIPPGVVWQQADASDAASVAKSAAEVDVVVSALGPSREPEGDPFAFAGVVRLLAENVATTRLVVVGGAGSLLAAPGVRLVDTPEFPELYRPEALATAEALEVLRTAGASLDWTYLSPAPVIEDGERTGHYVVGTDSPVGRFISFADYAIALVDEIERPAHQRTRWTVASAA